MAIDTEADTSLSDFPRADSRLIERFAAVPAANVGDVMDRLGAMDAGISPTWKSGRIAGSAYTVWTRSGDNLLIHAALAHARPGDIVVVNGQGELSRALIGDLIGAKARKLGIAGFIIDGAIRDVDALAELELPVYARGVTPAGPYKHGPGHLARTIACGNVAVAPGDVIVADEDGVVVVPLADAEAVLAAAERKRDDEDAQRQLIDQS